MGACWAVPWVGICILTEGMVVEGVEIIDTRDEEIEMGTYVMGSGEEVVGWKNC